MFSCTESTPLEQALTDAELEVKKVLDFADEHEIQIRDRYNHPIALKDSTALNENLSVAHLIKKIFLVSDNDAYNFLFDFLGSDYINSELRKKGLSETSIHHKFLFGADNQKTWEYHFIDHLDTLYYQPSIRA
ncbi:class A beta-lactamase-related serine hydrolase [Flavobacteriaceae bacterium]|nr:class A beta-lactamase-related serine hydrolase [Flavobacteriaceae bacterium]